MARTYTNSSSSAFTSHQHNHRQIFPSAYEKTPRNTNHGRNRPAPSPKGKAPWYNGYGLTTLHGAGVHAPQVLLMKGCV